MSSPLTSNFEALPNPRGAAVRPAEDALAEARRAFDSHAATGAPLRRAAEALAHAGWLPAQRFAETLALASPFAEGAFEERFGAALADFQAALMRRNLRELACSTVLFEHYRELRSRIAMHAGPSDIAYEDVALAGKPIAPATMRSIATPQLARLRACYESVLLAWLRGRDSAHGALGDLDGYIEQLAGPDPYDVWRLAAACARALRVTGRATTGDADAKRFYARCNLLLGEQAHGLLLAPKSFVRMALALLWRDYALYGAPAEDADQVALLNDYGLTVDWHVAGNMDSEARWEAEAAREAGQTGVRDGSSVRELGVLSIHAPAYEDFLQTADIAMSALANRPVSTDASAALKLSEAAYRLGSAGCALGLGHIAALADALALAWRLTACAWQSAAPERQPEARAVDAAAQALRAMLLRVAAGVAPSESGAFHALMQSIERAAPTRSYPAHF